MLVIRAILALLIWAFLLFYVLPNIVVHPWETLALVVAGFVVSWMIAGHERLLARMRASPQPAVRGLAAAYVTFTSLVHGVPPYNEGRWWLPRTAAQILYWGVVLAVTFAGLFALGGVLTWLDKPT